ncbi:MAG: hypothetical protein FK732_07670, partial [Asgard group archaeon]|nr:hypothetical protein [Asgard group archaeon]
MSCISGNIVKAELLILPPVFSRVGLMSQICCKCGKSEEEEQIVDGFCISCYKTEFPLITAFYEKQFNLTACKLCGDLMFHSKWFEIHDNPKQTVLDILKEFLKKTKKDT